MQVENTMAICYNPVMEHAMSNRIDTNRCECRALQTIKTDFSKCLTTDEIRDILETLNGLNLHIVGSRGFVYHSGKLAEGLVDDQYLAPTMFPRTFGLRQAVIRCMLDFD